MSRDETARLLDAAVPPIPPELHIPPYERIRRRAQRRRMTIAGCGAAVAVVLVAVSLALVPSPRSSTVVGPGTDSAAPSPSSPASSDEPRPPFAEPPAELPANLVPTWRVALIRRSGTDITVYVNPPARCWIYPNPTVTVDERSDVVTLTVSGQPQQEECARTRVTQATVVLSRPIGGRQLREPSGATVLIERDNLPAVPGPWRPVPGDFSYMDGNFWADLYTRPGGPDLSFTVKRGHVTTGPGVELRLGSHTGVASPIRNTAAVQWQVDDLVYELTLEPSEGKTAGLDDLQSVVDDLTWP